MNNQHNLMKSSLSKSQKIIIEDSLRHLEVESDLNTLTFKTIGKLSNSEDYIARLLMVSIDERFLKPCQDCFFFAGEAISKSGFANFSLKQHERIIFLSDSQINSTNLVDVMFSYLYEIHYFVGEPTLREKKFKRNKLKYSELVFEVTTATVKNFIPL